MRFPTKERAGSMEVQYDQPGAGRHHPGAGDLDQARMWPGTGRPAALGGERPSPEEVRRWSHYFNLPWHQFQPQWAERTIVQNTLVLIVGNRDIAIAPSNQGRALILREVRYHMRANLATQDDPRDIFNSMAMDLFLDQSDGRRPFRSHVNTVSPAYFLPAFVSFSQSYTVGAINFAEALAVVPLLVVGNRSQQIVIRTNTAAIIAGAPDTHLMMTGWEINLPDDVEPARF